MASWRTRPSDNVPTTDRAHSKLRKSLPRRAAHAVVELLADMTSLTNSRPPWHSKTAEITGRKGRTVMNFHKPTTLVFVISLILVALAIVSIFVVIPYVTVYAFWFAVAAWVVLAGGCLIKM
jgi:uncharacterized Tic20 family protein